MKKAFILLLILTAFGLQSNAQNAFMSVCRGNIQRLDSLLENSSIDMQDNRGRSLLHWSIGCRQSVAFDHLIDQGIDINIEDAQGNTAMLTAIHFDNQPAFEKLVSLQKDDSWISKYGSGMLERAVLRKNLFFVSSLVNSGVDINGTNKRGSTALEIAQRIEADSIRDLLLSLGADQSMVRTFEMSGAYMGQSDPGLKGRLFAPNFISTEEMEFGSIFNSDGTEFYFAVDVFGKNEIRYSRLVNNQWTKPVTILSHKVYGYNDPFLSPDEQRLYFISRRAMDGEGEQKDVDIWYVEKTADGWSEPINAGANINSDRNEYYISFTNKGTMYFASNSNAPDERRNADFDLYAAEFKDGQFQKAQVLKGEVNTTEYEGDVFVAPDESYVIFCSTREDSFGQGDLYISFRQQDGQWSEAVNLGNEINTEHYEYCPFVTKDGKYLFYTSNQDIYWVSTKLLERYKK